MYKRQDKEWWIEKGLKAEGHFIRIAEQRFGINISINPEKKVNKYSPDLLLPNGYRADLKTVRTPFFKAGDYGMDPSSTVTFNHKDYIRYLSKNFYRAFFILFWCEWNSETRYGIHVNQMDSLFCASIHDIDRLITTNKSYCHYYKKRKRDTGFNAKASWLINLDDIHEVANGELFPLSFSLDHSEAD